MNNFRRIDFEDWDDFLNVRSEDKNDIEDWFNEFENVKNINIMEKKIIIITGQYCSFKTEFANFILRKFGYEQRTFNAIDMRDVKSIKDFIIQIMNNKSVLHMMLHKPEKIGIILDDMDATNITNDKSILSDLLSLLCVKKKDKKNEATTVITHPIICICQDNNDKKINELKKIALCIRVENLLYDDYRRYLDRLCVINGIDICEGDKDKILGCLDLDLRKFEHFVKDMYYFPGDDVDELLSSFTKKNTNEKSIENIKDIFSGRSLTINDSICKFYSDKSLYPFIIHENYLFSLPDDLKLEKRLEYFKNISSNLSKHDVIQNSIFEKQLWDLYNLSAILTLSLTNYEFNRIIVSSKYKKDIKFQKRQYTTLLNKVSLFFTNKKVYNDLLQKYGICSMDIYLLSEVIRNCVENKDKTDLLIDIIKKMNMDMKYLDNLVRISKFSENDLKKDYTCKYKNEIKRLINQDSID